jgi:DNA-binding XRE family transcriptional regulator
VQTCVTRQTINAIETGKYEASLSLALKIAHLYQALMHGASFAQGIQIGEQFSLLKIQANETCGFV